MKRNFVLLILLTFIFNACSVGTKTDLMSGLKISNNGLSYADGYLSIDQQKLSSNEFPLGKEVYLYLDGVEGFTVTDEKVFVGASLVITDESGKEQANIADLFESSNETGLSVEAAQRISINFVLGAPLEAGKKYIWKSKIWDKKGKGVIETESTFVIK